MAFHSELMLSEPHLMTASLGCGHVRCFDHWLFSLPRCRIFRDRVSMSKLQKATVKAEWRSHPPCKRVSHDDWFQGQISRWWNPKQRQHQLRARYQALGRCYLSAVHHSCSQTCTELPLYFLPRRCMCERHCQSDTLRSFCELYPLDLRV